MCHNWLSGHAAGAFASKGHQVLVSRGFYLDFNQRIGAHYEQTTLFGGELDGAIMGGEAALWSEWVSRENVEAKLWPRCAAIAERFWSPATRTDLESLLLRLPALSGELELDGAQHRAGLRRVLLRIGGHRALPALVALADALRPLEVYPWKDTIDQTTPLTRLENALAGGASEEAELFALRVERFVAHMRATQLDAARALGGALVHGDDELTVEIANDAAAAGGGGGGGG